MSLSLIPHIIHDERNGAETILYEMSRQRISHFILEDQPWSPLPAVQLINLAHKQVIQAAKDRGDDMVCVMEDDVMFPAKDGYEIYIRSIPDSFHLYLGGCYNSQKGSGPLGSFSGLHCYICHSSFYDTFLGLPADGHIDNLASAVAGVTVFAHYPYVALQRPGLSRNSGQWVDYNKGLNKEDIYYGSDQ